MYQVHFCNRFPIFAAKIVRSSRNSLAKTRGVANISSPRPHFRRKGKGRSPLKELLQRQWCGRLGKVENCQVTTFLAHASSTEFALVDRRLYLPQEWIEDKSRCNKAGIPQEHQAMKTRHEQALEMIVGRGKKLPHKWIAGDDEMGKVPWFRRELRAQNEPYMFAVPSEYFDMRP
jgi:FOG: Transposase